MYIFTVNVQAYNYYKMFESFKYLFEIYINQSSKHNTFWQTTVLSSNTYLALITTKSTFTHMNWESICVILDFSYRQ